MNNRPPLEKLLTIYGRKPVLEALRDNSLELYCLHLAESNKPGGIIDEITATANRRGLPIRHHDKKKLGSSGTDQLRRHRKQP